MPLARAPASSAAPRPPAARRPARASPRRPASRRRRRRPCSARRPSATGLSRQKLNSRPLANRSGPPRRAIDCHRTVTRRLPDGSRSAPQSRDHRKRWCRWPADGLAATQKRRWRTSRSPSRHRRRGSKVGRQNLAIVPASAGVGAAFHPGRGREPQGAGSALTMGTGDFRSSARVAREGETGGDEADAKAPRLATHGLSRLESLSRCAHQRLSERQNDVPGSPHRGPVRLHAPNNLSRPAAIEQPPKGREQS